MVSWRKAALGLLLTLGILVLVGGTVGEWRPQAASGQQTVVRVEPGTQSVAPGTNFTVNIVVDSVSNLGSYEWQLTFNPALVEFVNAVNGPFLGSSGRTGLFCPPAIVGPDGGLDEGNVRFGCVTAGLPPPGGSAPFGPDGSGLLTTVTLSAVGEGSTNLDFAWVSLGDPNGDDIPSQRQGGCVAIGAGASCASPTVAPPTSPTPPTVPTPGGATPTSTATSPGPTATPTGPLPTPTPLPPGFEAVPLAGGCQFEAWTGSNGTGPQELAGLVGPAGNLRALWAQQPAPSWKGYSPAFPDVSDMGPVNLLDVVAICTTGPGDFVRPII